MSTFTLNDVEVGDVITYHYNNYDHVGICTSISLRKYDDGKVSRQWVLGNGMLHIDPTTPIDTIRRNGEYLT